VFACTVVFPGSAHCSGVRRRPPRPVDPAGRGL